LAAEASLTMLMIVIYGAAAVGIAAYMVAALLRPDKF
jgi:K+-transporting ATPase KdpF subunit